MMPPNKPNQMGRITITGQFDMSKALIVDPAQHTVDDLHTLEDSTIDFSSVTYISDYTPVPTHGVLPCRCKLLYLAVSGLASEIGARPHSPSMFIQCGRWTHETAVQFEKGNHAEWLDVDWFFPVSERMNLTLKLMGNKGKPGGKTGWAPKQMGSFSITAKELVELARNKQNVVESIENLIDGAAVVGKVKYVLKFDYEGDEGFVTDMIDKQIKAEHEAEEQKKRQAKSLNPDNAVLITGYGEGVAIPAKETADGYKLIETKPFVYSYLPETHMGSRPDRVPFRMTIVTALAIDMKPAHTFAPNSPRINAACGAWAAISNTVENAGVAATWTALTWAFFVYERKTLRVAVWSRDTLIGTAVFEPEALLAVPCDRSGKCDIVGPMISAAPPSTLTLAANALTGSPSKAKSTPLSAGQVKLTYFLESMFDEQELDSHRFLPNPIKIDPPLRMTLFTIAANGLRQVHLFSPNSAFVKAACGKWFASTKPIFACGKNAKWEEIGWSIFINEENSLKITLQSDNTVIGFILLTARELCDLPIDKYGLTEVEANLNDGRNVSDTGRIRIVCRLESHLEEPSAPADDNDDLMTREMKDMRLSQIYRTLPDGTEESVQIPRVVSANVLGITLSNLRSVHTFAANSPHVIMECGDFVSGTPVQVSDMM